VLGREATCDVVVADRQISRYHARLTPTPEGVILEDLGSKNGTHHNGVPLTGPVVLQDGDLFSVALAQQFLFLTSDATMPLLERRRATGPPDDGPEIPPGVGKPAAACPAAFSAAVQNAVDVV
jgi:pSer/pThr/pTyr-binding forkhead associated (FHA) protein